MSLHASSSALPLRRAPPSAVQDSPPNPKLFAAAGLLIAVLGKEGGGLAGAMLSVFRLVGLFVWTTAFSLVVGKRYRGTSQAFLVISYLLGQIIVCLSLWFGILIVANL